MSPLVAILLASKNGCSANIGRKKKKLRSGGDAVIEPLRRCKAAQSGRGGRETQKRRNFHAILVQLVRVAP